MKVLFDLLHPAHFHLFKNVIVKLREGGHEVEIIIRQKDCLPELVEGSGFAYHLIKRNSSSLFNLGVETIKATVKAIRLSFGGRFDVMAGTSISIGPAARLTGAKAVMFEEDDARAVPVFAKLGYPIAHYVVTPKCLEFEKHGQKHLTYAGYHELAYLHPDRFTPDAGIIDELRVGPSEKYFLVRLVALTAHHDVGQAGLSIDQAKEIIERLSKHGRVFISAESTVDTDLEKYILPTSADRIFDVLAFAHMVIGDSQTMAAEAAVLGTPSLRCNTFVGRLAYLEELEHKYGLTAGFLPADFDKLLAKVDELMADSDLKQKWEGKRKRMLAGTVDLTDWIFDLFSRIAGGDG